MADIEGHRQRFEDFLTMTQEERVRAEKRRDYRDLRQWTEQEANVLKGRKQAPIVFDRYSKKVDSICGLEVQRRSDPKALPVHPKHEKASEVITDGLRFVESKQHLDETFTEAFEDKIVEGYNAIITEVEKRGKEYLITPKRVPWDRIYYDAHSRNKDFSDSSFFGITLWMDLQDAIMLAPGKEEELKHRVSSNYEDETFADRPNYWIDSKRKRIRINQEYYLEKGKWMLVYYTCDLIVIEAKPSPYLDEDGEPMCPIEMDSDFVDRENNRRGYMQRFMDPQDEVNHRRSKALHMLSRKKVIAQQGAFLKMTREQVLKELAKAEAYLETSVSADEVSIDDNQDMGQSQLAFYQDAQNEMDESGVNPELAGRTDQAISGRAFIARQQSGMIELAQIFARHSNLKRRVYRQIWLRMRQYWTKEKWIRVSDSQDAMRFVGINIPVTLIERKLEEKTGMTMQEIEQQDPELFQQVQQAIKQDPRLGEIVDTRNNVKELDMDITIEEGPDSATLQQEQFDTIANLAGTRADPQMFRALVMLSNMNNKKEVLELFEGNEQAKQAAQAQEQEARQVQMAAVMGDLQNQQAETEHKQAQTAKVAAETQEIMSKIPGHAADTEKALSEIPLNRAKTAEQMASASQKLAPSQNNGVQ